VSKIVVYTCITNEKDLLRDPAYVDKNVDYVCYTDTAFKYKKKLWNIVEIPKLEKRDYVSQAKYSKYYRIMSHKLKELNDYDISLYIDGSIKITESIIPLIDELKDGRMMACSHNRKGGLYAEIDACISNGKDRKDVLEYQRKAYKARGYPKNNENLWALKFLVRKNKDDLVNRFNEIWYQHIVKYSNRAQIGFPYVVWKLGIKVKEPGTVRFTGGHTRYFFGHKHLTKSIVGKQ